MQMAALLPPKWLTMDAAESDKKEKRNKVSSHANDDHQVLANEMQHPTLVLLFLFFCSAGPPKQNGERVTRPHIPPHPPKFHIGRQTNDQNKKRAVFLQLFSRSGFG